MKRRWIGICMGIVMLTAALAGCSKPEAESEGSESSADVSGAESKKVEITWLHHFQEEGIKAWMEEMITSFEEENPDIKINVESVTFDSYDQTLKTKGIEAQVNVTGFYNQAS